MLSIFTIVLDGMPYIQRHLPIFSSLKIPWRWVIVEGSASAVNCTSWCKSQAPRLSNDGTTEYLRSIKDKRVTVIQRDMWHGGKVSMVNAALAEFVQPGILMQVDSDEVWTSASIESAVHALTESGKDRATFKCNYYVGPDIITAGDNCYGNKRDEWARMWRFFPGQRFIRHEPPILSLNGSVLELKSEPSFEHYAYADEKSVAFKERYYGYTNAVSHWSKLQKNTAWPVRLRDFLPWVDGRVMAIKAGGKIMKNENRKMLICISYRSEDMQMAISLLNVICDIEHGINAIADIALVARADAIGPPSGWDNRAKQKFSEVHLFRTSKVVSGYPEGCNEMFYDLRDRMAMASMCSKYDCWFNLEPDCIPLSRDWISKVWTEWKRVRSLGGLAMGHVKMRPQIHLNGAAVYASEHANIVTMLPPRKGWAYDLLNADRFLKDGHDTPLIGGIWNKSTISEAELFGYTKTPNARPVVFHGVKDSSAVDAVRKTLMLEAV